MKKRMIELPELLCLTGLILVGWGFYLINPTACVFYSGVAAFALGVWLAALGKVDGTN